MKTLTLAAAALLPTLASAAGLLGTTVDVNYHLNALNTLDSVTVVAGTELTCPGAAQLCTALTAPTQTIDLGDDSIRYAYAGTVANFDSVAVNGFDFQGLYGSDTGIANVQLETNIAGLDLSRVSFGNHRVQVNMSGLTVNDGTFFQLGLQTAPIPEPASAALLLGGLGLLALRRRR